MQPHKAREHLATSVSISLVNEWTWIVGRALYDNAYLFITPPPHTHTQAQGQQAKPGHRENFKIMMNTFHVFKVCLYGDGQHYLFIFATVVWCDSAFVLEILNLNFVATCGNNELLSPITKHISWMVGNEPHLGGQRHSMVGPSLNRCWVNKLKSHHEKAYTIHGTETKKHINCSSKKSNAHSPSTIYNILSICFIIHHILS